MVNLAAWAKAQRLLLQPAYRWVREGTLPMLTERFPGMIVSGIEAKAATAAIGAVGLYAWVSSDD